jgi:hypothetical protein
MPALENPRHEAFAQALFDGAVLKALYGHFNRTLGPAP